VTGGGTATGYGLAPTLQGHLFSGQKSSPYIGVGMLYATLTLDNVTASAKGVVANAGYEWRWTSGLGILLGGGVAYLGGIHATDGVTTVDAPSFTHLNLEAGLRYMFL
jgi:outer membrane protein W